MDEDTRPGVLAALILALLFMAAFWSAGCVVDRSDAGIRE